MAARQNADLLVENAGRLYTMSGGTGPLRGAALREVQIVENGALAAANGEIVLVGTSDWVRERIRLVPGCEVVDAEGAAVIPGFVDPHTHAVFAQPRAFEFGRRLCGESYVSIAQSGGGIRASVRDFRTMDEAELVRRTRQRLTSALRYGTTTIEIKSGYGLSLADELKALRVVRQMAQESDMPRCVATCLAAHEIPDEARNDRQAYLRAVCDEILPAVAREGLAERVDVFCEPHVFSVDESRSVLQRGRELGLRGCVHADELEPSGGAELAAQLGADSADHLGRISPAGIAALAASDTVAVLLPGTIFSLGLDSFAPARTMIEAGVAVALATDFNPGSCHCESMPLILAIACTRMRLHPHEALAMATRNAACALGRPRLGRLESGAAADFVLLRSSSIDELCQHLGLDEIDAVYKGGRRLFRRRGTH
jgi:imidazolonepropionase